MRIPLNRPQGKPRRAQRRTYESAITQPTLRARQKTTGRRPKTPVAGQQGDLPADPRLLSTGPTRPRSARWPWFWARFPAVLLLMALIAVLVYASSAEEFFVYGADVLGNHHIDGNTIYQQSGVHQQNIFWIQPDRVARTVVQLPGIKEVHVRCRLPAQVTIEVTERQPLVLWRARAQGNDWWLDDEGIVLPYHGVVSDTIFVLDSSEQFLSIGARVGPEGVVHSVRQLAASLPEVKLFYYEPNRGLSFTQTTSYGSWPVYVGDSSDLARKVQVLQALTDYFVQRKMQPAYVDVRWADYPVYGKPAGKASSKGN